MSELSQINEIKRAIFNIRYYLNTTCLSQFPNLDQYTKCKYSIDLQFNNFEYALTYNNKIYLSINRSCRIGLKSNDIIHSTMFYHKNSKNINEYGRYAIHKSDLNPNKYLFELTLYDKDYRIRSSVVGYLKFID